MKTYTLIDTMCIYYYKINMLDAHFTLSVSEKINNESDLIEAFKMNIAGVNYTDDKSLVFYTSEGHCLSYLFKIHDPLFIKKVVTKFNLDYNNVIEDESMINDIIDLLFEFSKN